MPNNHEDATNYDHVKALVRDLHTTRNDARPEQLATAYVQNIQNLQQMRPLKTTSYSNVSLPQKLAVHQFKSMHNVCTAMFDDTFIEEEDDASDRNNDVPFTTATQQIYRQRNKENGNDINITVPSVVVTDVHEPLDLIQSTQRRFSQLYSGLRRLSTSNTVGWQSVYDLR